MFGEQILNGKQLCQKLGVSTTLLYQLIKQGMPYHELVKGSRKYYNLDEIQQWLSAQGFHQVTKWTK